MELLAAPFGLICDRAKRNQIADGTITVSVLPGHWAYEKGRTMIIGLHSSHGGYKATLTNVELMTLGQVTAQAAINAGYVGLLALKVAMKQPPGINSNMTDASEVTCLTFAVFAAI
jgi:hypothetical protein